MPENYSDEFRAPRPGFKSAHAPEGTGGGADGRTSRTWSATASPRAAASWPSAPRPRTARATVCYLRGAPAPVWMVEGVPATLKGRSLGLELTGTAEAE